MGKPERVGGTGGFPAPPKRPWLKGRNRVRGPSELSGHEHLFRVHGKVGETAPVAEEGLARVPVEFVLADGVLHVLSVEGVLEFRREDGDAVEEEGEVDALFVLLAEAELADHREEVGPVQALQFLVEPARRPEVREAELAARVLDAVAQHVERSPAGDLAREPAQEARLHVGAVVLREFRPLFRLGGQQEVENVGSNQAELAVVVLGAAFLVAARHRLGAVYRRRFLHSRRITRARVGPVLQQRALDRLFEGPLGDVRRHRIAVRQGWGAPLG